jgi:hypothetical protein
MSVIFPILQLHKSRWIELEVIDMDLLGRTGNLWFIRFGAPDLHVVSVILVDRVIALSLSLCRLDPECTSFLLLCQLSFPSDFFTGGEVR